MTEPLTRNRVDIKAILADPLLREELIYGATDFICKVEGIRRKEDLEMTELSPQAQAVLWAGLGRDSDRLVIAAALRAAADQVVPEYAEPVGDAHDDARHDQWMRIRYKLLAIAAELEATK